MGGPRYCNGHLMTSVPARCHLEVKQGESRHARLPLQQQHNPPFWDQCNCNYLDGTVKECVMLPTGDKQEKCQETSYKKDRFRSPFFCEKLRCLVLTCGEKAASLKGS